LNSTTHFQCDLISTFLKAFSGRDASQAFLTYHRRAFPHKRAEAAFHATDESVKYSEQDNRDFLDLCEQIEKVTSIIISWKTCIYEPIYFPKVLPRLKSFAPWSYFAKIIVILAIALSLEAYIHFTGSYKWYLTGSLGIVFALIGNNSRISNNRAHLYF